MLFKKILMILIAAGVLVGGVDQLRGDRWGLGSKFVAGIHCMGPTALCITGILYLAPVLGSALHAVISPLFRLLSIDPAMSANILALDMGGYELAMRVADDPALGALSGLVIASMFGCTLCFLLPMGMMLVAPSRRDAFCRGVLIGFIGMPFGILCGGALLGLPLTVILWNCIPVLLLAALLGLGIWKWPDAMARGFAAFSRLVQAVSILGLMIGSISYLTGWTILPGVQPIEEALGTVGRIAIVLLGSTPLAELCRRWLKKPLSRCTKRLRLGDTTLIDASLCMVNVIPVLSDMERMPQRDVLLIAAAAVSITGLLGSHLGFVAATAPELVTAVLLAKAVGGLAGMLLAYLFTAKKAAALAA